MAFDADQDEFAKLLKVSTRSYVDYEAGRTAPKAPQLAGLVRSNVNLAWLVCGEGEMFVKATDDLPSKAVAPHGLPPEFVLLPRYDVRASGGSGTVIHNEQVVDFHAFRVDWIGRTLGLAPERLALISAVGDSMRPTIKPADILLLDVSVTTVETDAIYALISGDALLVKRLQRMLTGGLRIVSDNPAYAPQEVPESDVPDLRVVGRVIWHGGLV